MLKRAYLAATMLMTGTVLAAVAGPASASGDYGPCSKPDADSAVCTFGVSVDGSAGSSGSTQAGSNSGGDGGGSSESGASPSGSPSHTLSTPCTYQADPSYQPTAGSDPHPAGAGGWYVMSCPDALSASGRAFTDDSSIVWLATPPAATAPDPATLAATAESELKLTTPPIATSPRLGLATFPGVNVWVWVPASSWSSKSATATAAGESVTATAVPTYSTWDFGDGTSVTCDGPGTEYEASYGANPVSPTCGHAYTQPGSYTETVTVHWSVTWKGAGQLGAFNDLTTATSVPVTVGESEAIVTR